MKLNTRTHTSAGSDNKLKRGCKTPKIKNLYLEPGGIGITLYFQHS